LTENLRKNS